MAESSSSLFIMSPKPASEKASADPETRSLNGDVDEHDDGSDSKLQRRLQSRHLQMIAIGRPLDTFLSQYDM